MAQLHDPNRGLRALTLGLMLVACASGVQAQSGDEAKKAARRAQLQAQQLQQQAQEAEAAKAKIEGEKAALDKQLREQSQQVARLKGALPKALQDLKTSEAARAELAATVASLEKQLAEQKTLSEAAQAATQRTLRQRDEQQALLQRQHDAQVTQVNECSAKNERLVKLSAELLDRYRKKSVSDVLSERDPVLGLGDVKLFNLVQEVRDKADAERYAPSTTNR